MSIIEQATRRLEDLASAGVVVPWAAAGLAQSAVQPLLFHRGRYAELLSPETV